jgi:hypothetical protein
MIVDCAHYRERSRQSDRPISLDEAATQCLQGGFVWSGMFEPSGEELDEVRESFGLHELAVEDGKTFHLRPKVEEYQSGCSWSSCAPPATTMTRTRSISARSASSSDLVSSLRFDKVSRASYTAHGRGSSNTPNCLHWALTRFSGRSWTR